ncbi:Phospholipase [Aspergillus sclerotialis]|uniref:phospholipase D n=1 Tax=Aspergillus sclerotialis TaxID=2070753 RepID=A0A3A2ZB97_9EURO|nr:Phospholipase [Aspergillus sclerotialis]
MARPPHSDDHLAYGRYYPQNPDPDPDHPRDDSTRGFVGDTFKKLRDTYKSNHPQYPSQSQSYHGQGQSHGQGHQFYGPSQQSPSYHDRPYHGQPSKPDKLSGLLGKIQGAVADIGSEVAGRVGTALDPQGYAEYGQQNPATTHRFGSFAPARPNNDVKWYVDGCSYFYAVSRALETAKESIWILDWWLSPELYLRRPPAKNEQYRLDRMLQAAARRGVQINIIVYKEVTQALTLSSSHTKHHLEDLSPNIAVFRHPDHLPDRQELASSIVESLQNLSLDASTLVKLPGDTIKGLYGMNDDVILYWAHHEKLCLIDGRVAFMGGLDMCFGRWDTHQHTITDVHPTDLNETVFPGQDYNNARVLDFHDVVHWEKNQLDRRITPRMGWSDISVSLHGPVVEDLRRHFVERWNFIYDTKYDIRKDSRYGRLALYGRPSQPKPSGVHQPPPQQPGVHQAGVNQPGDNQPGSIPNVSPPSWQGGSASQTPASAPGQSPSHPYTYTSQSFPPPPPGPPPSQSSGPIQSQPPPQLSYSQGQQGEQSYQTPSFPPPSQTPYSQSQNAPYFPPPPTQQQPQTRDMEDYEGARGVGDPRGSRFEPRRFREEFTEYGNVLRGQLAGQIHQYQDRLTSFGRPVPRGNMHCQILRSCCKWSNGSPTEHSIADAYAAVIRNSDHFVYIENQFFITATGDSQKPVNNKIGAAIVERILRAARAGQKYKIVVVIPSIPSFAGDLADESTLALARSWSSSTTPSTVEATALWR